MKYVLLSLRAAFRRFKNTYFRESLDFRALIFNTLALVGILMGIVFAISNIFTDASLANTATNLFASLLGFVLLIYANRTGRFQLCFLITVFFVFFIMFPVMFFSAGGYRSGMPPFFVFAVVFTMLMLQGRLRKIVTGLELVLFISICLIAYFYPETVVPLPTPESEAQDIIIGFIASSLALAVVINQHIKVYDRKQERLEHIGRTKTQLIGNISHELKTPLTVVSINIQTVADQLGEKEGFEPQMELLANAQREIMRLARLVNGTLSLETMSSVQDKAVLDMERLLTSSLEPWYLPLLRRGNRLQLSIGEALPQVFGHADLLAQVVANLMQNANTHTQGGEISISAEKSDNMLLITVADSGAGVPAELLPRIFERGVSGGASTGYGLFFCKTVVEAHGGTISIDSEEGEGCRVHVLLPPYEGQLGGHRNGR